MLADHPLEFGRHRETGVVALHSEVVLERDQVRPHSLALDRSREVPPRRDPYLTVRGPALDIQLQIRPAVLVHIAENGVGSNEGVLVEE